MLFRLTVVYRLIIDTGLAQVAFLPLASSVV